MSLAGKQVQATLTDSGAVVLASRIGPGVEALRGTVVAADSGSLSLAVSQAVQRDGVEVTWKGENVRVPLVLTRSVELRTFSKSRTVLFSALVAGAMIAMERAFHGGGANALGPSPGGLPSGK